MSLLTQNLLVVEPTQAVTREPIWRMSVEQYHAMVRAGILTEDDPVDIAARPWHQKAGLCPSGHHRLLAGQFGE